MKTYPLTHYEYMIKDNYFRYKDTNDRILEEFGTDPMDFMKFAHELIESKIDAQQFVLAAGGSDQVNLAVRMAYHIWRMKCCGEKIYYLTNHVCDLILNTRLTIDTEFIESPFETIYLYTDQNQIRLTDYSGTRPMRGVYVTVHTESDGMKRVRFLATSGHDGVETQKDVNHYASFIIPEHGEIEEICEKNFELMRAESDARGLAITVDTGVIKQIFKFVINSLIYIGCRNADLSPINPITEAQALENKKSNKKIRKLQNRMTRAAQKPFILVTHKRLTDKNYVPGSGKPLDHEVMVGGHWRGQWYGPEGNKQKKVIRIASYTKGMGLEKGLGRNYVVK